MYNTSQCSISVTSESTLMVSTIMSMFYRRMLDCSNIKMIKSCKNKIKLISSSKLSHVNIVFKFIKLYNTLKTVNFLFQECFVTLPTDVYGSTSDVKTNNFALSTCTSYLIHKSKFCDKLFLVCVGSSKGK
jgi:hypothetical protein